MKRFYLFGSNITNSFSPRMHSHCFQQLNLPYTYQLYQHSFQQSQKLLQSQQFGGASITIPYKKSFSHIVQYIGQSIDLCNINTIVKENNLFKGYNTDYIGIQNCLPLNKIRKAFIIGCGATASTILWVLTKHEIPCVVASRSPPSQELVKSFSKVNYINLKTFLEEPEQIQGNDIIISSTPNIDHPLSSQSYKNNPYIFDVNYRPKYTPFIQRALDNGVSKDRIIYGAEMLIYQGLEQNYLFTGKRVKPETKDQLFKLYEELYN